MDIGKANIGVSVGLEIAENGLEGMGRVLTIQIEITDWEKALWIWQNHMGKDTHNGVFVQVIREGEMPEEEEIEDEDE